jgi:peptidoglycan/xylan/chitin deacetylase (PgdA/CDA1 family)
VAGRPLLAAGEIARMATEGIRFGAHTRTHASLPGLSAAAVEDEVGGSRRELAGLLGSQPPVFAYPYGRFDSRAVEAVREAGFAAACTAAGRAARAGDDALLVPRIEIRGTDSAPSFLRKLWFGDSA